MQSLNESLLEYGKLLRETNMQAAYKGLIQYMKVLRKHFKEQHPEYDVSVNLYQGYMDLTFFSFTSELTKKKDLKYIVVFNHEKMKFDVWLSGKNRAVMSKYHKNFSKVPLDNYLLTADAKGMSSIIETTVVENPDFDHPTELTKQIDTAVINFIQDIENTFLTSD